MVFNVKKLLVDGMDLMLWQKGKKKRCERNEWQVLQIRAADGKLFASEHVNTNVYLQLLRQHVIPWVQRMYPDRKYIFWLNQRQAHATRTTCLLLVEFWIPADWPPYLPNLNLLDLPI